MNRAIPPPQLTALSSPDHPHYRHRPTRPSRGRRILVDRKHLPSMAHPTFYEHGFRLPADLKQKKKKRKREDDSDLEGAA